MNLAREFTEGIKISASAIFANKLRSGLTTLGIVIGIVTVSLMAMAIDGLRQSFIRSISALGADVFYIEKFPWEQAGPWWKMRNRRDFAIADAKVIQRESVHTLAISVENSVTLPVRYKDRDSSGVWIVGNNEQSALVRQLNVKEGRFFSEAEVAGARPVCVLGSEIADKLFPQGGALGERIQVGGKSFEVIGLNEKFGQFLFGNMDNQVIIPITRLTSDFVRNPYIFFMVKIRPESKMEDAREELRGIVRKIRRVPPGIEDDFAINQQDMVIKQFDKVGKIIASVGLFITGLALFVGGIGIMNIMFVSVAERTKEIGIRKAIGAKRRTILIQFLIEAAVICLLGGLIGLGVAWGASVGIKKFLPTQMSPTVAVLAILVSLVTGIVAGFLPAYRAARMSPVDALRAE
ncbi:MAG TPA: ABC transporter permease [Methylomirabilota bacterium]|nr:ABC transporter permease [Methylomirabilota bacterium]